MLLATGGVTRSQPADLIPSCEAQVVTQAEAASNASRAFSLDLRARNGARLVYLGVRHTFDPADPQFGEMKARWEGLRPTEAYYEGSGTFVGESLEAGIKRSGEPGLVRSLAAMGKIPAHSLEPTQENEARALLKTFTAEQLVLFYVTRNVSAARDRLHQSGDVLERTLVQQLDQVHRTPALAETLPDVAAFRAAYGRWFPGSDPVAAPTNWFDPLLTSAETGSRFFNDVNHDSSALRDTFMYRTLANAAKPGARIFAEVGRDHIPAQAAALRCALQVR